MTKKNKKDIANTTAHIYGLH